jgi:hypothetical protein
MGAALTSYALKWGLGGPHRRSKRSEEHKISAYASNRNFPRSSGSHISLRTDRAFVVHTKTLDCYLAVRYELTAKMNYRQKLTLCFQLSSSDPIHNIDIDRIT